MFCSQCGQELRYMHNYLHTNYYQTHPVSRGNGFGVAAGVLLLIRGGLLCITFLFLFSISQSTSQYASITGDILTDVFTFMIIILGVLTFLDIFAGILILRRKNPYLLSLKK